MTDFPGRPWTWRAGAQRQAIGLWPAARSPASTGSSCAVGNGPSGVAREWPLRRLALWAWLSRGRRGGSRQLQQQGGWAGDAQKVMEHMERVFKDRIFQPRQLRDRRPLQRPRVAVSRHGGHDDRQGRVFQVEAMRV